MVGEYSICDFTKNPQSHKIPALGVVPSQRDSQVEDLELLKIKVWLWFTELLAWKPCDWHHMRRRRWRLAEACVRVCLWTERLFHCYHCSITAVISFLGFHWQKADKGSSRGTGAIPVHKIMQHATVCADVVHRDHQTLVIYSCTLKHRGKDWKWVWK